jgi:putative intracellular protease/amidase
MKRILILCLFIILISNLIGFAQEINILVIMPNQYGANYNYNRDDYAELGWNVTLAGLTKIVNPCATFAAPLGALPVTVDVLIPDITDVMQYDCIAIMPSSGGHADLLNSEATLKLISTAADSGVILWATCSGVKVLAAADVIRGKKVVGKPEDRGTYTIA